MTNTPRPRRYVNLGHPRFWPGWVGIATMWSVTQLPFRVQRALGAGLGHLFFLTGKRRKVTEINLRLCFPEQPANERLRLLREHYIAAGIGVFETAAAWWTPARRLRGHYDIEGLEHLEQALQQGCGALLVSGHFTSLEICARCLGLETRLAGMYRPSERPLIDWLFRTFRARHVERVIRRDDVKGMLRALRDNLPVWYAPDQAKSGAQSVVVDFFGVPAATHVATDRIARISGAPVIPFRAHRGKDQRYHLQILPALTDFPGDDPVAATRRINALIEDAVREAPEQYFWSHRRFKNREGLADPYHNTD